MRSIVALPLLSSTLALAHDGHGAGGAHWHASDAALFALAALAIGALLWWSQRK